MVAAVASVARKTRPPTQKGGPGKDRPIAIYINSSSPVDNTEALRRQYLGRFGDLPVRANMLTSFIFGEVRDD